MPPPPGRTASGGGTIAAMQDAPRIQIPRWIQLVGLPLLLLFVWVVLGAVRHVVFLFLVAALIALLLDPIVRGLIGLRLPRGISIAIVYLSFAGALILVLAAIGTSVVNEATTATKRVNTYVTKVDGRTGQTAADHDVDRLQAWLNHHGLKRVDVQTRGHELVKRLRERNIQGYSDRIINFLEGAALSVAQLLISLVLIFVASIYMLLDFGRLRTSLDRRFPPREGQESLLPFVEQALIGYVKAQALISLIIGASAGLGIYLLGVTGLLPHAENYALIFGAWVALTEVLPYLGPWLGAIPAGAYALVVHPTSIIWVTLLFLGIHQLEGHIVVPKVMGTALRLNPLLVIFGLLAGAEIYGLLGIFVALPLLAVMRALWEFFSPRVVFEPWKPGEATIPVEVEPEAAEPPAPRELAPVQQAEDPPAAAQH